MARAALAGLAGALIAAVLPATVPAFAAGPCGSGSNPIECENSQPGTPMSDWYSPSAWGDVEGFTNQISYAAGDTVQFKVKSPVPYQIHIYRLGWYGGDGARLMPTSPTATFPAKAQPACDNVASTGLQDCGNWSVTANWTVPSTAVSGVYLAELDQTDGNGLMPYPFVIRSESSHSDIVVQTSDETWQAYNMWGANGVNTGTNLYQGNGPALDGRSYQVSYNRPMDVSGDNGLFGSEYAMLGWLERNGYDVSYLSGVDVSTKGPLLLNHKVFVSSGHDEYWTQPQWDNVMAARAAGVNLAFFSGNEVFWRARLAPSVDGSNAANRTLVCYKMTKMELNTPNGIPDPTGQWTGTWMDPKGASTGGGQPQNQLTGTLFKANGYRNDAITVSAPYAKLRLWRGTSIANLTGNQVATFPTGTLGYEWDVDGNNGFRPPGAIDLSSTTVTITDGTLLLDNGNTYGNGTATHSLVQYRDPVSHALVFGAGTVQWSWGLGTTHVGNATTEDVRMQQATVNLFADMGVQPRTRQANLAAATASTDTTGPAVSVTSPANGATVPALAPVTITGTAGDLGGGQLARVEVSTDGGTTWQPTAGLGSWSFTWTPTAMGSAQIKVRGVDDSVNVGAAQTVNLTVGPQQCPCTVFPAVGAPGTADAGDGSSVELGVKIRTTAPASVTGIKFYKSALNTGAHTGSLWTASGQRLATGTFTGETATGWQTLTFPSPVPVRANTTYIASYFAPNGHYAADAGYFTGKSAGLAPLQGLQAGTDGGNGVYHYGSAGGFPAQSYNDTNYWVDAIVETSTASTQPPAVLGVTPAGGAVGVAITAPVTATFTEAVDSSTVAFTVKNASNVAVPATVTTDSTGKTVTLQPSGELALGAAFTASIQASDLWGNAMTAPYSWSFTTSGTPPAVHCPCSIWPASAAPAQVTAPDPNALTLGTRFSSAIDGYVTGVRFYKGPNNTGTHTGSLWTSAGSLLATGTFTGETASGWQTLTFATPVPVTAQTAYVVSYYAPNGQYSVDGGYFTAPHSAYPLTALADGAAGGNGLYHYGAETTSPIFPTGSYGSSNYWVDPIFTVTAPAGLTASGLSAGTAKGLSVNLKPTVALDSVSITVESTTPVAEADEGSPVTGTIVIDRKARTATFKPDGPLVPLAAYELTLHARDQKARVMEPVTWNYTAPRLPRSHPTQRVPAPPTTPVATLPPVTTNPPRRGTAAPTGK
jgi:hypothetical protein